MYAPEQQGGRPPYWRQGFETLQEQAQAHHPWGIAGTITEVQGGVFLVVQVGDTQAGLKQQPGDWFDNTHKGQKRR